MTKGPPPPRPGEHREPAVPVRLSAPCTSCRHSRYPSWFARLFRDAIDLECQHPIVVATLPIAAREGWMIGSYLYGGPVFEADPVTGTPERVRAPCSLIRSEQFIPKPVVTDAAPRDRAQANCGPDGRYWERRGGVHPTKPWPQN